MQRPFVALAIARRAFPAIAASVVMIVASDARSQPAQVAAAGDFRTFYAVASTLAQSPPEVGSLAKACESAGDSIQASFWAPQVGKIRLVVFSGGRIGDLSKVVSLRVLYTMPPKGSQSLPSPTARPGPAASLDWAYVFDRNGDGKVDYLVYLVGAHSVEAPDFPAEYPKAGQPANFKNYELLLKSARLVFKHLADDNFDGTVDAVVAPLADPDRPMWVHGNGVLRSSHFDGVVDEEWAFKHDITQATGHVPVDGGQYVMGMPAETLEGRGWLGRCTEVLSRVNAAAGRCRLGADAFARE